jgi:hypothetical protein
MSMKNHTTHYVESCACLPDQLVRIEHKLDLLMYMLEKQNVRAKSDFCPVYGCMERTQAGVLCAAHRPEPLR